MSDVPPNNPYPPQGDFQGQPQPIPPHQQAQGDGTGGVVPYKNPKALAAYYCSIFALIPCLGIILGSASIVLGILGLRDRKKNPIISGAVHSWIGIVLGGLIILAHVGAVAAFAISMTNANSKPAYYRTSDEIPSQDGLLSPSTEADI